MRCTALERRSAELRYAVATALLLLLALLPLVTFVLVDVPPGRPAAVAATELGTEQQESGWRMRAHESAASREGTAAGQSLVGRDEAERRSVPRELSSEPVRAGGETLPPVSPSPASAATPHSRMAWQVRSLRWLMPSCVAVWIIGVTLLSLWHLLGWTLSQRLRWTAVDVADPRLRATLQRLCLQLDVTTAVEIRQSVAATAPLVMGWWRPVLLVPASVLTGLSASDLEAILAHELAHIRRHDYLVNLGQSIVETFLFYHPAVWWLSHQVRVEREYCADDAALRFCQSPADYVRALASLGQLACPHLAVTATGPALVTRMRRVLGLPLQRRRCRYFPVPSVSGAVSLLVTGLVLALLLGRPLAGPRALAESQAAPPAAHGIDSAAESSSVAEQDAQGDPLPPGAIARIGSPRLRHTDIVLDVAYAPDGQLLASAGRDGVRVWEARSGKQLHFWPGRSECVAFAHHDKRLAVVSDGAMRVFRTDTGELLQQWERDELRAVAYGPDDQVLLVWGGTWSTRSGTVVNSEGFAELWEASTGKVLQVFPGHGGRVFSAALSQNAAIVATASQDNAIRLYSAATGQQLHQLAIMPTSRLERDRWTPSGVCVPVVFHGQTLAAGMPDNSIRLFSSATGGELQRLDGCQDTINAVAFSPDGQRLAAGGRDRTLRVWNVATGEQVSHPRAGHASWIECVAFGTDGTTLASGSQDHTIRIVDSSGGAPVYAGLAARQRVRGASVSGDGKWYAAGGPDGVHVWDAVSGRFVTASEPDMVNCVAFAPGSTQLAAGTWQHGIVVWTLVRRDRSWALEQVRRLEGPSGPVMRLSYTADGQRIVASWGGKVRVLDVASGQELPAAAETSVQDTVAFGLADRVWELIQKQLQPAQPAAIQDAVQRCERPLPVHTLVLSADNRMLAVAKGDGLVELYDTASGQLIGQCQGHDRPVNALSFSGDTSRLVTTCGDDLTALVWDVSAVVAAAPDRAEQGGDTPVSLLSPEVLQPPVRTADLAAPVQVTAGGKPIDVDGFAAPFVGDLDGDGTLDLLVGQAGFGRLRIYRNVGSNAQPRFDSFEWFRAGGRIASIPVGCQVGFTPDLVDFDGDGDQDMLTGSMYGAVLYLFRRLPDGSFAAPEPLENRRGQLDLGRPQRYNATVFAYDWDADGDLDLLLGRSRYCLVPNEGTCQSPLFGDAVDLQAGGQPMASGYVPPVMADWDGDGLDDLLLGHQQGIVWCHNIGTRSVPSFQAPQLLLSSKAWQATGERVAGRPRRPQAICVADFNGDGRADLLLGDHEYVKRELSEEDAARYAQAREQGTALRERCFRLLSDLEDNESPAERRQRVEEALQAWQQMTELPWVYCSQGDNPSYQRHGNVWLYLRLAP